MEKEVLECVLKRQWKDYSVQKVLSVESAPAVGKFLNFMSEVTRLELKLVLGNGRVVKRGLIVKQKCKDPYWLSLDLRYRSFETEIKMYSMVLKEMEYLMDEFEDTDEILWGHLIYHEPFKFMVMEDLKELGFKMLERPVFFNLDHCLIAVHSLGRYHGMCKVLQDRGIISKDDFKDWFLFTDPQMNQNCVWDITGLLTAIKLLWDPEWTPIVDKIKLTVDDLMSKMSILQKLDETKFNVLNHGDLNKNNIFFKYDWQNRPSALRFIDFQMPNYGSPCIDLCYLMYLNTKPSVRRENYENLVNTYYDSLIQTLEKFCFTGSKPSIEEIQEGMDKYSFMGLSILLAWYAAISNSGKLDELLDYKKISETDGQEGHSLELYNIEDFENEIGPDVRTYAEEFF